MRGKIALRLSNCFWCRFIAFLIFFFFFFLMTPFASQAEVVRGKITSIRGNVIELNLGIEKGIRLGDSGRVCYNVLIQGKEKPIYIAKFKITHLSDKSSVARVEEKTGEVKVGHLVEVFFKGGELEVSSAAPPPKAEEATGADVPRVTSKFVFPEKICQAPVWNVGDTWTFKNVMYSFVYEIVESKGDFFLLKVKTTEAQTLRAYDKKTINYIFGVGADGQKTGSENNPFRKVLNFPIFVGKKWTDNITVSGVTDIVDVNVEGIEEVVSGAGKFKTYKIFLKETSMPSLSSGWVRYWYSPEVKMWVKMEVEKTPFWGKWPWLQDFELIFYDLK